MLHKNFTPRYNSLNLYSEEPGHVFNENLYETVLTLTGRCSYYYYNNYCLNTFHTHNLYMRAIFISPNSLTATINYEISDMNNHHP